MQKFKCSICGYIHDEAASNPEKGIAAGTKWEDIADGFSCPICTAPKAVFKPLEEDVPKTAPVIDTDSTHSDIHKTSIKKLSAGEISAICSNLAKGCEKQRLTDQMEAWNRLSDYYKSKEALKISLTLSDAAKMLDNDLSEHFPAANSTAKAEGDRGALRSLTWSEKVSTMMKTLLTRFEKEGNAMLENTRIYVCEICGFIYIGDCPPDICPVCKVPNFRIAQVERR